MNTMIWTRYGKFWPLPLVLVGGLLVSVAGLGLARPNRCLKVVSHPEGARAWLNGRPVGNTPCRLWAGSRGRLVLELAGYQTSQQFLWLEEPEQELQVWLQPGAGCGPPSYPPLRGTPPDCWLRQRPLTLGKSAYFIPPSWSHQSQGPERELSVGDGQRVPRRQARVRLLSATDLAESWQGTRLELEREGYLPVSGQCGRRLAWWRLERPQGLSVERRFLQWKASAGNLIQLDYRFPYCHDAFAYTRDLDYLRAALLGL